MRTQWRVWNLEEWQAMDFSRLSGKPEQMSWTSGWVSLNQKCWGSLLCQRESCFLSEEIILHDLRETLMVYIPFFRKYAGKSRLCRMHKAVKLQVFIALCLFFKAFTFLYPYSECLYISPWQRKHSKPSKWSGEHTTEEWCSIFFLIFCLSRSGTRSLWQKGPYATVPALQCNQICCVCTVKPSWADFGRGAPSSPLVSKATVIIPMLRSLKASWNHWVYWECTIIELDV